MVGPLREYWHGLWREATHAFERAEILRVLALAIIALAVAILTSALGLGGLGAPHFAEWTVGVFVILLFVFIAPYRLWLGERTQRKFLESQLKSGLEICLDSNSMSIEPAATDDGTTADNMVVSVGISNVTDAKLHDCRVQLQILTPGRVKPARVRYIVSEPFSLLPNETDYKRILEWYLNLKHSDAYINHYVKDGQRLVRHPNRLALVPDLDHEIVVEALSANSRAAKCKLSVRNDGETWTVDSLE